MLKHFREYYNLIQRHPITFWRWDNHRTKHIADAEFLSIEVMKHVLEIQFQDCTVMYLKRNNDYPNTIRIYTEDFEFSRALKEENDYISDLYMFIDNYFVKII